jgi:type III restriction enzyme
MVNACADTLETAGQEKIRPVVAADASGSSRFVDFHTTRNTLMATDPAKSQVNYVMWDSTWEAAFAERIEKLDRVRGYVKNNGLGFEVPYTFMGDERGYRPDFIVLVEDGRTDPLHVVVEIKGFRGPDAQAKHDALMRLWLPAVSNDGRWGRWQAMEIVEPTDMTIQFSEKVWAEAKQGEAALQLIAERLDEAVKQARAPDSAAAA